MSIFVEALDRVKNWLVKTDPNFRSYLQLGLTHEDISSIVKDLPFQLSKEVYELYQWHNGTPDDCYKEFLPGYMFLSLEQALKVFLLLDEEREDLLEFGDELWQKHLFPIFMLDQKEYLVLLGDLKETSPVLRFVYADVAVPRYPSLTNMMLAIAECYELGAYYLHEDGYLEEDEQKADEINRKYGSIRSAYEATLDYLPTY